ncbi:MAG: ribosome biogenesis GTPase YlqF, partial [Methylophilus methylotrophus]
IDGIDLLEAIAKRRSYKRNDGEWDMERTAMALLTDYRSGAIGRVSLESPQSRAEMLALAAENMVKKTEEQPQPEADTL